MKTKVILIEDDCAPDAYEYFVEEMKQKYSLTPENFKKLGKKIEFGYELGNYRLEFYPDAPQWHLLSALEKINYPYSETVKGIRYESDFDLRKGTKKGGGFNCPDCNTQSFENDEILGFSPVQMNYAKYPNLDIDVGYVWEEKRKCKKCKTVYYIENGV